MPAENQYTGDIFRKQYSTYEGAATDGFMITANNTNVFSQPTRALYVGTSGNVCVQMVSNSNTVLTFPNVNAGAILPIRVSIVFANSTASNFVGLY